MLPVKKFKPKKGKKKQEFLSKKGKNIEQGAVDERPTKPFPRGKSKNSESSPAPQSPSEMESNLQQLFDSRNASLKRKRSHLIKERETETSSEVTLKVKKRKETTAEMVEMPHKKKFKPSEVQVQSFPRGSPKQSLEQKPDRKAQRSKRKIAKQRAKEEDERLEQTLFVGNLPISITRNGLEKLFNKFGTVESVRLRGAIPSKTKLPKKIAEITRNFHDGLHSRKGFVVFKDVGATTAALALNGTVIDNQHIVVNKAKGTGQKKMYEDKRTVFVGNLPFDVDDESVWNAFALCGEVEAVRVIRDKTTGAGKGFGYVLFRTEDSKEAAINKEKVEIDGRNIRVKSVEGSKKQKGPKQNFRHGLALKAKSKIENPQSRKSTKKLLKKEKVRHDKKKIASNFKKFF